MENVQLATVDILFQVEHVLNVLQEHIQLMDHLVQVVQMAIIHWVVRQVVWNVKKDVMKIVSKQLENVQNAKLAMEWLQAKIVQNVMWDIMDQVEHWLVHHVTWEHMQMS